MVFARDYFTYTAEASNIWWAETGQYPEETHDHQHDLHERRGSPDELNFNSHAALYLREASGLRLICTSMCTYRSGRSLPSISPAKICHSIIDTLSLENLCVRDNEYSINPCIWIMKWRGILKRLSFKVFSVILTMTAFTSTLSDDDVFSLKRNSAYTCVHVNDMQTPIHRA